MLELPVKHKMKAKLSQVRIEHSIHVHKFSLDQVVTQRYRLPVLHYHSSLEDSWVFDCVLALLVDTGTENEVSFMNSTFRIFSHSNNYRILQSSGKAFLHYITASGGLRDRVYSFFFGLERFFF